MTRKLPKRYTIVSFFLTAFMLGAFWGGVMYFAAWKNLGYQLPIMIGASAIFGLGMATIEFFMVRNACRRNSNSIEPPVEQ